MSKNRRPPRNMFYNLFTVIFFVCILVSYGTFIYVDLETSVEVYGAVLAVKAIAIVAIILIISGFYAKLRRKSK